MVGKAGSGGKMVGEDYYTVRPKKCLYCGLDAETRQTTAHTITVICHRCKSSWYGLRENIEILFKAPKD